MNIEPFEKDAAEINELHEQVQAAPRITLEKSQRIGERLSVINASLPHGAWERWMEDKLHFSKRTANRYILTWENRELLKSASVTDLTGAYRAIADAHEASSGSDDDAGENAGSSSQPQAQKKAEPVKFYLTHLNGLKQWIAQRAEAIEEMPLCQLDRLHDEMRPVIDFAEKLACIISFKRRGNR